MDSRSKANISSLLPEVQPKFRSFVEEAQALAASKGYEYKVICGTRTYAEQAALYRKGRDLPGPKVTNALPGYSMHNFGLAVDMGLFKGGDYIDDSHPSQADDFHKSVAPIAAKFGLKWGGNFTTITDTPHFELDTQLSLAQLRDRKAKNIPLLA